jgi:hypothetical protein
LHHLGSYSQRFRSCGYFKCIANMQQAWRCQTRLAHCFHRISASYIIMYRIAWKSWCLVHERKAHIEYGLLQRIFDAARHINNVTVLQKVKRSLGKRTKQTADILNSYFKQCTVYNVIILSSPPPPLNCFSMQVDLHFKHPQHQNVDIRSV